MSHIQKIFPSLKVDYVWLSEFVFVWSLLKIGGEWWTGLYCKGYWFSLQSVSPECNSEAHPNPRDTCSQYLSFSKHWSSSSSSSSSSAARETSDWIFPFPQNGNFPQHPRMWQAGSHGNGATGQTVVIMSLQIHSSDTGSDLERVGEHWLQLSHPYPHIVDVCDYSIFLTEAFKLRK